MVPSTLRGFLLVAGAIVLIAGCKEPLTAQQKQGIQKLQERGARINFSGGGLEIILKGTTATDDDMQYVVMVGDVVLVDLTATPVTDAGLKQLGKLPELKFVVAPGSKITPEGADEFERNSPHVKVELERTPNQGAR